VSRRTLQIVLGLVILVAGAYLVLAPRVVADALGLPYETSTQKINMRASWGGVVVGLGAFVAWLQALRPWSRAVTGLLLCAMAGIGVARAIGFVLDGNPDGKQWLWLGLEAVLVVVCAMGLRRMPARPGQA
jgi:hypothetical protein